MNKKILMSTLIISALSYASEISINGDVGYNFNILNKEAGVSFEPTLPVELQLKFQPSEIDLKGELNIENKKIDGLFKSDGKDVKGMSIDGNINFLTSPLYNGLKIGANLNLIASKGNKYNSDNIESGDVTLEIGLHYDFGKIDTGLLIYYNSNQIMSPKSIGGTYVLNGYDTSFKITSAYNLMELFKLKTYVNVNNIDLRKVYSDADKSDFIYYYDSKSSSINSLVPVILKLNINNSLNLLDNLSLDMDLNANLDYVAYNAKLNKTKLNSSEIANLVNDGDRSNKSALTIRKEIDKKLNEINSQKPNADKDVSEEISNTIVVFNADAKYTLKYEAMKNLDLIFTDKIGYKYNYNLLKTQTRKDMLLSNDFKMNTKHSYEFENVEGLSLLTNGNLNFNSEFVLFGNPLFSIQDVDNNINSNDYTSAYSLSVGTDVAIKYNIFETLAIRGGLGIELEGIFANGENKSLVKYNKTTPKIFVGLDYSW